MPLVKPKSHLFGGNKKAAELGNFNPNQSATPLSGSNPFGIPFDLNQIVTDNIKSSLATEQATISDKQLNVDNADGEKESNDPNKAPIADFISGLNGGEGIDVGELSGFIVPGLDSLISAKQSKKFFDDAKLSNPDANFRFGQVTDLARPNFATPARAPQGSSLAEREASQKFGDVAQRGQEAAFELENSASRITQQNQIDQIANAETQFNAQRGDAARRFNSGVAANRGSNKEARAQEALIGLTQNLQSSSAQRGFTKSNAKIQTAKSLISSGQVKAGMKLLGLDTTGINDFTPSKGK